MLIFPAFRPARTSVRSAAIPALKSEHVVAVGAICPPTGQLTVTEALAWSEPSLVVVTLPVLFTVPHEAVVVGLVRWTVALAPAANAPMLQVSVPLAIEQVPAAVAVLVQAVDHADQFDRTLLRPVRPAQTELHLAMQPLRRGKFIAKRRLDERRDGVLHPAMYLRIDVAAKRQQATLDDRCE